MRIGYACLTKGIRNTDFRSCKKNNATDEKLLSIIESNLDSLKNILEYNGKNNIRLFRISSDIIPFGSSPVNKLPWWNIYKDRFDELGKIIKSTGQRVSMHPGQYTVINSPRDDVVQRAIEDLEYHCRVLDCLETGPENKIVLHVGGVYGNKPEAVKYFIKNYYKLSESAKERLVIENDDKSYTISDVLEISEQTGIPVVFDNLHHEINKRDLEDGYSQYYWISKAENTWKTADGNQKIHYSQQNKSKKAGSHSDTILINEFIDFYKKLQKDKPDIMLEVKDKNISALKCVNILSKEKNIRFLEEEWARYKYNVLEHDGADYQKIRDLLKDKNKYPVFEFYNLIDSALEKSLIINNQYNSALHVWGYFSDVCENTEKMKMSRLFDEFLVGKKDIRHVKNQLQKFAVKYRDEYLLSSYYFDVV